MYSIHAIKVPFKIFFSNAKHIYFFKLSCRYKDICIARLVLIYLCVHLPIKHHLSKNAFHAISACQYDYFRRKNLDTFPILELEYSMSSMRLTESLVNSLTKMTIRLRIDIIVEDYQKWILLAAHSNISTSTLSVVAAYYLF